METILAQRYSFCDFTNIYGFPHPVPTIAEWDDYLPRFRRSKHDQPGEHLLNFHKCMLEHGFVHEDVLIKMFNFSLEGYAREWCQSLPTTSIHSLKDFHMDFNSHFEKIYPAEILFEECCEKYKLYILQEVEYSSCDELCEDIDERECKDEIQSSNENMNKKISFFFPKKKVFQI